jgi:hypothetical protein
VVNLRQICGKQVVNKRQNRGKLAAKTRLKFAVICPEKFAAKFDKYSRQSRGKPRGKNSAGRGKLAAKCRGKLAAKNRSILECRLPRLCRDFAANLAEVLKIIFRANARGKLTNTL